MNHSNQNLSDNDSISSLENPTNMRLLFSLPVIVAALGYFVDIYDMLVFSIVRVPSLKSMGLSDDEISKIGTYIINWQQAGLVIGGFLWGIVGDKKGRLSVLFGSIIMYSLANIACGFVKDPDTYAILRFIAGVGLSGEIGAAITLVAEILPKRIRGYGTAMVAGIGFLGAAAAYLITSYFEDWKITYWIGGVMGLLLLLLRIRVFESGLFAQVKQEKVDRGDFMSIFTNKSRFLRYIRCVGIGIPTWFVVGILATFGNEFGKVLGVEGGINPGKCIMFIYFGLAAGDLLSGLISDKLQSRRKTVLGFLAISLIVSTLYLFGMAKTSSSIYFLFLIAGFGIGYIAMFLTMTAEQFGTNLRATATTSVPAIVRGLLIPMTLGFQALKPTMGVIGSALLIGATTYLIAFISLYWMEETYGKDLGYLE
jgi:predicted MFS family arabinose efflux permease